MEAGHGKSDFHKNISQIDIQIKELGGGEEARDNLFSGK